MKNNITRFIELEWRITEENTCLLNLSDEISRYQSIIESGNQWNDFGQRRWLSGQACHNVESRDWNRVPRSDTCWPFLVRNGCGRKQMFWWMLRGSSRCSSWLWSPESGDEGYSRSPFMSKNDVVHVSPFLFSEHVLLILISSHTSRLGHLFLVAFDHFQCLEACTLTVILIGAWRMNYEDISMSCYGCKPHHPTDNDSYLARGNHSDWQTHWAGVSTW